MANTRSRTRTSLNRVAIYLRLSDEDKDKRYKTDESESIQNQKIMLTEYCEENNWVIYDVYSDEDYSGADRNRPDWCRMIDDCKNGKVDIVLCKTQSRFSRDMEVIEKYIHGLFVEWGIRFVSIVDHADTDIAGNKKSRQINGLVNEWYLEDLSHNIRRTLHTKRLHGECTASFAPYGYMKDPEDKNHLVIDPIASKVVKDIFYWAVNGTGYVAISQRLNANGISPPGRYKKENGGKFFCRIDSTGEHWNPSSIYKILHNEVYTGTLVQEKSHRLSYKNKTVIPVEKRDWVRIPNAHEAIIDPDTWKKLQSCQSSRTRQDNSGQKYMLCGKVFCSECNSKCKKVITHSRVAPDGHYRYFRCKLSLVPTSGKPPCQNSKGMRIDYLEQNVLTQINALLDKYHNPDLIEVPAENEYTKRRGSLLAERDKVDARIDKTKDHIAKLYMDHLDGSISEEQFHIINEKFSAELTRNEKRITAIEEELENIEIRKSNAPSRDEILMKYTHIDELTYDIVNTFIEAIYVGAELEDGEPREIRIEWRI